MSQHKQFEIMCALAAVGQLNPSDLAGLRRHAEQCADCQRRLSDFAQVSAQALMLFGERSSSDCKLPTGMTARFVARAREEGIPLQKSAGSVPRELFHTLGWRGQIAAALLILAVIAGIPSRSRTPAFSTSPAVTGASAVSQRVTPETNPVRVRSTSRLSESRRMARGSRKHRGFEITGVERVHSSELGFVTSLRLTPSGERYPAIGQQAGFRLDCSPFSRPTETREPRFFQALAISQQTGPVTPGLISVNSLPPVFRYATDKPSFSAERSPRVGTPKPDLDWSRVRLGVLSQSSSFNRLPRYPEMPEPRWPFANELKVDTR